MKAMLWLHITAVLSCLCFAYGASIGSLSLSLLELMLLPINAWRLFELFHQT
ncbi:hypothetical protein NKJ40_01560 [Mesorhizobium sp. M0119]|uniref:hypothetical protein n=1 Tax=unclassified Mesorhizobium TaxID=325217 RepID=UPI00333ACAFC